MVRVFSACLTIALILVARPAAAQAPRQAPGAALFGEQCATCHGADARGLNGPNLILYLAAGATDERVLQIVRNGVPGTAMPASRSSDEELRAILAYVKSLAAPPAA